MHLGHSQDSTDIGVDGTPISELPSFEPDAASDLLGKQERFAKDAPSLWGGSSLMLLSGDDLCVSGTEVLRKTFSVSSSEELLVEFDEGVSSASLSLETNDELFTRVPRFSGHRFFDADCLGCEFHERFTPCRVKRSDQPFPSTADPEYSELETSVFSALGRVRLRRNCRCALA